LSGDPRHLRNALDANPPVAGDGLESSLPHGDNEIFQSGIREMELPKPFVRIPDTTPRYGGDIFEIDPLSDELLKLVSNAMEGLNLVGAGRFERPTPCAQGRCATRLRYAPTFAGPLILNYAILRTAALRRANDI
jgi:hypothetical protein